MDKEREAFEKWASLYFKHDFDSWKQTEGTYWYQKVQAAWSAWQARAQQAGGDKWLEAVAMMADRVERGSIPFSTKKEPDRSMLSYEMEASEILKSFIGLALCAKREYLELKESA
jgi:hypothetical protein